MSSSKRSVLLRWTGDGLVFRGGTNGSPEITVDSDAEQGASPTELLLLSIAGCMGVDVLLILEKSRVPVESLEVEAEGDRAESDPRRFHAIRMVYRVRGPGEEHQSKLDRAVQLSRDKYCSVLHTLDPGIDFDIRVERR